VQSIVRLTRATSIDGYVAAVEGRIDALARAHGALSDSRWQGADFGKLVAEEIAPYRTPERDKIAVAGPKVVLEPATAQSLALALHELATNAAKYGSLSTPMGQVRLTWEIRGNLVFDWSETGGPPSSRRQRRVTAAGSSTLALSACSMKPRPSTGGRPALHPVGPSR
jgi:two-component sensor histidine kinase